MDIYNIVIEYLDYDTLEIAGNIVGHDIYDSGDGGTNVWIDKANVLKYPRLRKHLDLTHIELLLQNTIDFIVCKLN